MWPDLVLRPCGIITKAFSKKQKTDINPITACTHVILHPGAELDDDRGHVPQHVGRDGHGHEHVHRAEDELAHVVGVEVAVPSGGQRDEGPVDGRAVLVENAAQRRKIVWDPLDDPWSLVIRCYRLLGEMAGRSRKEGAW